MPNASTSGPRARGDVQQQLEQLVTTGQKTGIQVAAYLDGELVIDTWAGVADPESGRPVDSDTLIQRLVGRQGRGRDHHPRAGRTGNARLRRPAHPLLA